MADAAEFTDDEKPGELAEISPEVNETIGSSSDETVRQTDHPNLHAAMIAAFAEIKPIDRGAEGQIQNRRYAYATLADILAHVRPILAAHGLAVYQPPIQRRDEATGTLFVGCATEIMHTSGEYRRSEFAIACPNETPQGMGSVLTYARRYSYPFFIQADEDDDDGAAGQPNHSQSGERSRIPPSEDDLPRAGTTRRSSSPAASEPSAVGQSDSQGSEGDEDPHIERPQAITLTGLATRRAQQFDGVSGADILSAIAKDKNRGTWAAMWPFIRMSQVNAVSKLIQEWEPPKS